jgi:uncharacterized membrane protein YoaK (UPF0700 family)
MSSVIYQILLVFSVAVAVVVNLMPSRRPQARRIILLVFDAAILIVMVTDIGNWPQRQPWAALTIIVVSLSAVILAFRRNSVRGSQDSSEVR